MPCKKPSIRLTVCGTSSRFEQAACRTRGNNSEKLMKSEERSGTMQLELLRSIVVMRLLKMS
jgi:hypothetical protein